MLSNHYSILSSIGVDIYASPLYTYLPQSQMEAPGVSIGPQ